MKLLITSIDAIFDNKTGEYFEGIKDALYHFENLDKDNKVLIVSSNLQKLRALPSDFKRHKLGAGERRGTGFIQSVNRALNFNYQDIIVLGGKRDDMILAANSKLLLLNADYSKKNNPTDVIFTQYYGIAILNAERLKFFCDHFLNLTEPWYYTLEIDEQTKLYGLTNAMTRIEPDADVKAICDKMRGYLKSGLSEFRSPFLIYALMGVYQIFKDASDINYWGYYHSSSGQENIELKTFKEVLRKSFKYSMTDDDILIRHTQSVARKTLSEAARINNGCDSEFDSIILNPYFSDKIAGKNVCIIDDFTNHGSSCETIRHLLKKAGVNKIIFISLGKFRTDYKMFNYAIDGDVYKVGYNYKRTGNYKSLTGVINQNYSDELIASLKHLVS
jgi:hypothetical protein